MLLCSVHGWPPPRTIQRSPHPESNPNRGTQDDDTLSVTSNWSSNQFRQQYGNKVIIPEVSNKVEYSTLGQLSTLST